MINWFTNKFCNLRTIVMHSLFSIWKERRIFSRFSNNEFLTFLYSRREAVSLAQLPHEGNEKQQEFEQEPHTPPDLDS